MPSRKKSPTLLTEKNLSGDPIVQFSRWFEDAKLRSGAEHPEAMCLSTADPDGLPSGRWVLLKGFDEYGFVFFTNLESAKGKSLKKRPAAALTFYWEVLGRQVRIRGRVEKVSSEEADDYFQSRPRDSRLAAWASRQSRPIISRDALLARFRFYRDKYQGREVPRPAYWSGFRVIPEQIEFWQARPNRLHDRFLFSRSKGVWKFQRLNP